MKTLRITLSIVSVLFLAIGYAGSQYAVFDGSEMRWSRDMDSPPIAMLALLILIAAVACALIRDKESS
jgi:hypothetical protein